MTQALLISLCLAWGAQIILGAMQIARFNRAYIALSKRYPYLGVGRSKGRFRPRVLMVVALDEQKIIRETLVFSGLTVFSKPRTLDALKDIPLKDLPAPATLFPNQERYAQALAQALTIQ